jgi:N-acetylmuramoyl-L-alanine amidase
MVNLRLLLASLTGALLLSASAEAATLQTWRFDRNQNNLELKTDRGVQPRAVLIFNPTRLVIDLPGIALGRSRQTEPLTGAFRSMRVAQFNSQTTRLVIELAPGYTLNPEQIKFRGITANHWTVQIPAPQPLDQAVASSTPPTAETTLAIPAAEAPAVPAPRLTVELPRSDAPLPQIDNRRIVVVIDPGHGGPDPGAIGIGGLREVDVIMPISFQVAGLLRQQGIEVVMTREEDIDLGLQPRVQTANRANATLFVSIHANAISMARPDVNGVETFYYDSGRGLADSIQRNLLAETGMRDRRVRRARFYVLRWTSMPSVLVEVGFVTGAEDAPRLADSEFRSRIAVAIARGILEYMKQNYR